MSAPPRQHHQYVIKIAPLPPSPRSTPGQGLSSNLAINRLDETNNIFRLPTWVDHVIILLRMDEEIHKTNIQICPIEFYGALHLHPVRTVSQNEVAQARFLQVQQPISLCQVSSRMFKAGRWFSCELLPKILLEVTIPFNFTPSARIVQRLYESPVVVVTCGSTVANDFHTSINDSALKLIGVKNYSEYGRNPGWFSGRALAWSQWFWRYKYQPVNYVWYESPTEFSPIINMNSKTIFGLAVVLCSLQGIYGDNVTISSNYTTSSLALTGLEAYIEAAQAAAGEAMANFTENMNNANANASAILSSGFTSALQYAEAAVAQGKSAAATIEAAIANLTQEINNTVTNSSTYKALEEQKAILDGIAANITTGWATAIQLANSTAAYASKQGVAAVANLFTVGSNLSQIIRNGTEAAIAEGETAFRSAINSTTTIIGDSANDTVSRFVSALSTAVNSGNETASSIASIFQSGVSAIQARYNNYASTLLASMASQLASAQNVTSTEFAKLVTAFTKLQSVGLDIGSAIVSTIQNDTTAVISEGESIASQVASNIESSISKTFNFGKDIAKVHFRGVRVDSRPFRKNSPQFTRPGSKPDLPIIDSPVYPESDAPDLGATEAVI
uniref:Uncharacterized protein n=1 Tax=Timema poppense TaxID=170557 RepID=A0A7R9GUT0_TIMPO|nr:unnamed protein product [Timema poppensis]